MAIKKGIYAASMSIFKDDLSNAISKNYLSESSDDLDLIDKFYFNKLEDYFNLNLNVLIENKKIKLNLLGLESKNDMYVCFLEIENLEPFTKLSLENKILFEIFKDQQNIIHVKKNSKKRSFISRINNSVLSVNI